MKSEQTAEAAPQPREHKNTSMRGSPLHRFVRRFVPSGALLTFNPLFKLALNTADLLPRTVVKGFRRLPPAHLRMRVGVGDEVLSNQLQFFYSSHFWIFAFAERWVRFDSNIVDLGCGCGRYAHHLRDINTLGQSYTGHYTGVDIDGEALAWCRRNFDERFTWLDSNDKSHTYGKPDVPVAEAPYRLPIEDGTQDFIFSTSLFTHLLEPEARNYLKESGRILRKGGIISHSVFCIDYPPPTYGTRHTFGHRMGLAHVESLESPEAAVAYTEADLFRMAEEAGFTNCRIVTGKGVPQPHLVAEKA